MIKKIVLDLDGKEVTLTVAQAKQLKRELFELFETRYPWYTVSSDNPIYIGYK